jgi:hypothetical protein
LLVFLPRLIANRLPLVVIANMVELSAQTPTTAKM